MRLWNTAKTTNCCSWTALGESPVSIAKAVLKLVKKGFAIDQTARLDIGFGLPRSGLYQA